VTDPTDDVKTTDERTWITILRRTVSPTSSVYAALILLLAICSAVGGLAGGLIVEVYHTHNERTTKEKDAFIDTARAMDSVIAYYVQFIINERPVADEAVQQVNYNIIKQRQLLQDVSKYLSPQDKHLVKDYGDLLLQFRDAIPASTDVLHMQKFWEDASKLFVIRNELIQKLQS
jgi:hypothetical protein